MIVGIHCSVSVLWACSLLFVFRPRCVSCSLPQSVVWLPILPAACGQSLDDDIRTAWLPVRGWSAWPVVVANWSALLRSNHSHVPPVSSCFRRRTFRQTYQSAPHRCHCSGDQVSFWPVSVQEQALAADHLHIPRKSFGTAA